MRVFEMPKTRKYYDEAGRAVAELCYVISEAEAHLDELSDFTGTELDIRDSIVEKYGNLAPMMIAMAERYASLYRSHVGGQGLVVEEEN